MITTNAFLKDIKDRALVPTTQNTVNDDTLLAWANDEAVAVASHILKYNEGQMLVTTTHTTTNQIIMIPPRALGGNVNDVKILEDDHTIVDAKVIQRSLRDSAQLGYNNYTFYVEGNKLVFMHDDVNRMKVELTYARRPAKLVRDSQARQVVSVLADGIVVNSMADFIGLGKALDVTSHSYNTLSVESIIPTLVDSSARKIQMDPTGIEVGDFVTAPETTSIIQLPQEYIGLLSQRVALRALMAVGDQAGQQAAMTAIGEMEDNLGRLVSNRMKDKPTKIFNRNSFINRTYSRRGI